MRITGAVLEEIGRPAPYADSVPLTVCDLELAPPEGREARVRLEAAGLCHSDLSVIDGDRRRPVPMLLGHEASAVVEEVGPDVANLAVGDRVVMTFLPRCGVCVACLTNGIRPCIPGSHANEIGELLGGGRRLSRDGQPVNHHLGVSAFATHAVVDERSVVPVPPDVPALVAALLGCAVLTGGGAVLNAAPPRPGDTVVVVGLGGVGMAAVMTAVAQPDVAVIGVDDVPAKLTRARELGAAHAYSHEEAKDAGVLGDVVVEAAGTAAAFEEAVAMTQAGGATVTVGLPNPDDLATISSLALVGGGRRIIGSYLGSCVPARDIPRFLDLWRAGKLPVEQDVSGTLALADINAGFDGLASETQQRLVVDFRR